MKKAFLCTVALSLFTFRIMAQTTTPSPTGADTQRSAEVDQRGDEGMGFSHAMTGHHFHLFPDGGSIEVESDSPDDNASKEAIRRHMQKIAGMFSQGDFSLPMFIHDTVPPGVEVIESNRVHCRQYGQRRSSTDRHQKPGGISRRPRVSSLPDQRPPHR